MTFTQVFRSSVLAFACISVSSIAFATEPTHTAASSGATTPGSSTNPAPTPPAADSSAPAVNAAEENKKVCRQRETLGSRLRSTRVCRTQAEWRRIDATGRQNAKSITNQPRSGANDPRMGGG
jgi:hypothetical protein